MDGLWSGSRHGLLDIKSKMLLRGSKVLPRGIELSNSSCVSFLVCYPIDIASHTSIEYLFAN